MKDTYLLYNELYEIAMAQKRALIEGRIGDAVKLQDKRQGIFNRLLDSEEEGSPATEKDDPALPKKIKMAIEKILVVDREMQKLIHTELGSMTSRLNNVQKTRAFFHSAVPALPGGKLNRSV